MARPPSIHKAETGLAVFENITQDLVDSDIANRLSQFGEIVHLKTTSHFDPINSTLIKKVAAVFKDKKAAQASVLSLSGSGWGGMDMKCKIIDDRGRRESKKRTNEPAVQVYYHVIPSFYIPYW